MVEPINLNKVRKAKAKAAAADKAVVNRSSFGRTKVEKAKSKLEAKIARETLDGAKREPPAD